MKKSVYSAALLLFFVFNALAAFSAPPVKENRPIPFNAPGRPAQTQVERGLSDTARDASIKQTKDDEDEDPEETFTVEFNVNMIVAEGFDPDEHSVWLTGNFTEWAEPGQEGSVQMSPLNPGLDANTAFYENFGSGGLPAGWQNNIIQGNFGWQWTTSGAAFGGQLNSTTRANGYMMINSDGNGIVGTPEEVDLISPPIDLTHAAGEIIFSVEHLARTYGNAECYIYISTDNFETQAELYAWSGAPQDSTNSPVNPLVSEFDISAYAGETALRIKFKWIGEYDYWWLIDDVIISATEYTGPVFMYYTASLQLEAGDYEYKYFSTHAGLGWEGGEWPGEQNRTLTVEEDLVLYEHWGIESSVSVGEPLPVLQTKVFPNPVRGTLNISSMQQIDFLRVFDMSGRMVYSRQMLDFETSLDTAGLIGGIYLIQLISGKQVQTHKIQVVK